MGIKEELKALVQLQGRELERARIDADLAEVERERQAARAEIAAAEQVVSKAETDAEEARAAAKRFDLDLKSAEEKVDKYKDQMHSVKTNEQLWALQEEITHAQAAVGDVETAILEQLEIADTLEAVIGEKKAELAAEKKRIDTLVAEADGREKELMAERSEVEAALADLVARVPDDLLKKYEGIKRLRGEVAVAEVLDEYCLVCNTKVRPQLYVETYNLDEVMQCENCKRIIYVAEPLGIAVAPAKSAEDRDAPGPEQTNPADDAGAAKQGTSAADALGGANDTPAVNAAPTADPTPADIVS